MAAHVATPGDCPLDVAGITEVAFDSGCEVRQVQELLLAQCGSFTLGRRYRDLADAA
jgi:hypothetical protein